MGIFRQYYGISDKIKENGYSGFMERFPILFQNKDKPMTETCMCFGIECPKGWYYILEQLCTELEYSNMESVAKWGMAIVAEQVKEKFGTLRFYFDVRNVDFTGKIDFEHKNDTLNDVTDKIVYDHLDMFAQHLINEAERMTEDTCANCGEPLTPDNKVETKGWISYICKKCNEKRENYRRECIESEENDEKNVNKINAKNR